MENMGNMIYRKGSGVKFQEPLEKRGELSSLSTYALQKKKKRYYILFIFWKPCTAGIICRSLQNKL